MKVVGIGTKISMMSRNGRLRWFARVKHEDGVDWIRCCTTMKLDVM